MLASVPGRAACCGPELAGFVVSSRLAQAQRPPLAQAIINQLPTLCYRQRALDTYRWFFCGPVLVSPPYRGRGLRRQLFEASRRTLAGQLGPGIAFITTDNAAARRVPTQALGLAVGEAVTEGRAYAILVFPAPR
jgi:GNAT superfamily N-acetyltransferase